MLYTSQYTLTFAPVTHVYKPLLHDRVPFVYFFQHHESGHYERL